MTKIITKTELRKLYIEQGLNTTQIGEIYGLKREAIRQRLIKFGIPRRDDSERHIGFKHSKETRKKLSYMVNGEKHPMYGKSHTKETKKKMSRIRRTKVGDQAPYWKRGVFTNYHGYVLVYRPDHPNTNHKGYAHRSHLVAEKALGRYLKDDEMTHHINGLTGDDRNRNLLICTRGYHMGLHNKLRRIQREQRA